MSMNEGITMDDMEDQTQNTLHQVQSQVNGNSRLASDTGNNQDDAEDLEELEQSLQALDENLDRSSPDLWPDHIPGVGQYLPATPYQDSDTPRGGEGGSGVTGGVLHNMTRDEMETLMQLGNLDVQELMSEVKRLQNIAYQLGQEESKEMTRGKYLNILRRKNNH